MSTTTRKPFGESAVALDKKLPAAPETRTSIFPFSATPASRPRSTASGSRTSPVTPATFLPSLRNCTTALSTFSCFRLATDTLAPCLAKHSAMPKLIPVVPPNTKTCFPAKSSTSVMLRLPLAKEMLPELSKLTPDGAWQSPFDLDQQSGLRKQAVPVWMPPGVSHYQGRDPQAHLG